MSIGRDDVRHVAKLAEIQVEDGEWGPLVEQMRRIVDYVAALGEVPAGEDADPFEAGPSAAPLREDVVRPTPLARSPEEMAPAFREGFFVVPRLGAMEDA